MPVLEVMSANVTHTHSLTHLLISYSTCIKTVNLSNSKVNLDFWSRWPFNSENMTTGQYKNVFHQSKRGLYELHY
jgi:hypothetical protein